MDRFLTVMNEGLATLRQWSGNGRRTGGGSKGIADFELSLNKSSSEAFWLLNWKPRTFVTMWPLVSLATVVLYILQNIKRILVAVSLPESSELVPGVMSLPLIRAPSLGGLNRATSISCGNEDPVEAERRARERGKQKAEGRGRESQY